MTPADEGAYAELARKISRGSGLALQAYKDKCIRRRIAVRMRACGVHSYADYHALLDRTPGEYERLRDALTINVTRFFRNAETWSVVRRSLVPTLCGGGREELLAWSAGCSSGEEPYTLAVLLADHLLSERREDRLDRVTIDATDVDRDCLERARAARYSLESLSDMPAELRRRHFEPVDMGYRVAARLRARVQVRAHDMTAEAPLRRGYHLILCRNVLIYFDRPMQERLFNAFADALAPGGFLVLGKVETLFGTARERLTLLDPRERVYRRPE
jgi:chemotaxis methyl-accepting protein methylase